MSDATTRTAAVHDAPTCDAALVRAFAVLGKRWNGVLLGTLARGECGFAELARRVGGICDSVLSERLSQLADVGLVERRVDPGPPVAVSYRLSATGEALVPSLAALREWAATHVLDAPREPGAPPR
jgi:DNA-binding HxlR family transcriptional regulator